MSKKAKILLILSCLALLIIIYIAITSESDVIKLEHKSIDNSGSKSINKTTQPTVSIEQLKAEYQEKVSVIMAKYLDLVEQEKLEINNLNEIREELLELKLSEDFKDLHINFILALDKMEDYLLNGDMEAKLGSEQLISDLLDDYSWLNT